MLSSSPKNTRERYGYRFAGRQVTVHKQALRCGDYALLDEDGAIQAAVERKTLEDLTSSLVDGSLQFALGNLAKLERAVVVIEAGYAALLKLGRVPPGLVLDLLARLQVRFHVVPLVFAGSRKFAEEIHLPLPRRRARR